MCIVPVFSGFTCNSRPQSMRECTCIDRGRYLKVGTAGGSNWGEDERHARGCIKEGIASCHNRGSGVLPPENFGNF